MELITPRLILRSMREGDEQLYCNLFCDPDTMRHIAAPWTRADAELAFRDVLKATRAAPPRSLFLTLIRRDTQQPVGLCTLQNFDGARRQAEFGVMVVSPGRTQGFASEAMIRVIAHAFAELSVDEVWARVGVDHAVCERLVIGVGMVRHSGGLPEDRAANVWRWSAYRDSWRPATPAPT
jgi:RimJ/RimL family protein N-acetyltransferase